MIEQNGVLRIGVDGQPGNLDSAMPLAFAKAGNILRGESPGVKAIFFPSMSFGFLMLSPLI